MDTQPENPEDIDRLLSEARKALRDFEDGADRKRLLLRLRTASPAHPVLLARFLFGLLSAGGIVAAVAVMVITMVDNDLARTLARFETVIPLPEEIPALPALMLALAAMMAVAWVMSTLAAMQLGRDATMLPWEQKQHQKLVNEVTRLTTQKAVMERIRSTPAGARPRIATPVPVSARTRGAPGGMMSRGSPGKSETPPPAYLAEAPPPRATGNGGFGPSGGGFGASGAGGFGRVTPGPSPGHEERAVPPRAPMASPPLPEVATPAPEPPAVKPQPTLGARPGARSGGLLARASQSGAASAAPAVEEPPLPSASRPVPSDGGLGLPGGYASIPASGGRRAPMPEPPDDLGFAAEIVPPTNGHGHAKPAAPEAPEPPVGGVRLGVRSAPVQRPADDFSDLVEIADGGEEAEPAADDAPPSGAGILGRARAGGTGLRSTPYGAAGRIRPPPVAAAKSAAPAASTATSAPPAPAPAAPRPEPVPPQTRGGTPLGAAPRAGLSVRTGRSTPPAAQPVTAPDPARPATREADRPGLPAAMFGTPPPVSRTSVPPVAERVEEVVVMEEEEDVPTVQTSRPTPESAPARPPTRAPSLPPQSLRPMPKFAPIDEEWLKEALRRAEMLLQGFPMQAYLEFSQEPHLPFTLVIARATPAMAVRAMVNFVEFLAGIATPPRARIELVNIPHLDRSFHKNVEAALEPYFGGNVEVEPNPGRVDILFTDPDPQWGNWAMLPIEQGPET